MELVDLVVQSIYNVLNQYGKLYFQGVFQYILIYAVLMGVAQRGWTLKDLMQGLFFPVSILNELGFLLGFWFRFIKERKDELQDEKDSQAAHELKLAQEMRNKRATPNYREDR